MLLSFLAVAIQCSPISDLIPNQYIVVFKDHVNSKHLGTPSLSLVKRHHDWLKDEAVNHWDSALFTDAFEILHRYHLDDFNAYAARLPETLLNVLLNHQDIDFIEQDRIIKIQGIQQNSPSWGLTRISYRDHPDANVKDYSFPDSAGTGVTAYVIDTGIFVGHREFQGRARVGKSFTKDGIKDGNGHGTHVAGTIGSKTYGVAKNVSLVAVKVLDARGSGQTSDVIAGVAWAAKDAKDKRKDGKLKSVANMSLGGGASTALDRAVKAAINSGLVFGVAAGNSGRDACKLSPARVPEAITVAASDSDDNLASFSEKGKCVDIIAPGVDIMSTWNNGKTNVISGTSMATPHVVGVAALTLAEGDFTTAKQVHDYLKEVSSKDKIAGSLRGAPNNLLFNKVSGGKFPDDEPKEPTPQPEEPEEPGNGECPIPQCLFDPECTSCCVDCFKNGLFNSLL